MKTGREVGPLPYRSRFGIDRTQGIPWNGAPFRACEKAYRYRPIN